MKLLYSNINKIDFNTLSDFEDKSKKSMPPKRKKQSMVGKYLLSKLLFSEYKVDLSNAKLECNNNGKPYLKGLNIYFNISHSHDYVICAVSNKEIGVDIEKIKNVNINSSKWFATKKEKEYILNSNSPIKAYFQIYTLKEAYFKKKGETINKPFDIEFIISKSNEITCSDKNVKCKCIEDINDYYISIIEDK